MGGLRKRIPVTFWTMTAGVLAIVGLPPLAGFFSKDEILYQAYISPNPLGKVLWAVGVLTAGLTSFYMFRLWFKTFFGQPRFEEHAAHEDHALVHASKTSALVLEVELGQESASHSVHESPLLMTVPLMILAILAVIGGWVGVPIAMGGHNEFEHFLEPVFGAASGAEGSASLEISLAATSVAIVLIGFYTAWIFYCKHPGSATALAKKFKPLYSLLDHRYWVDEIYGVLIVAPLLGFARFVLSALVDTGIIQGTASGLAGTTRAGGWLVRRVQSGNIRSYAGWLALGAACFIAFVLYYR